MNTFTITVTTEHIFNEGWGVFPDIVWDSDGDDARVSGVRIDITRIAADTVQAVKHSNPQYPSHVCVYCERADWWAAVTSFGVNLPPVNDDQFDCRAHWFATEPEAREFAESLQAHWDTRGARRLRITY